MKVVFSGFVLTPIFMIGMWLGQLGLVATTAISSTVTPTKFAREVKVAQAVPSPTTVVTIVPTPAPTKTPKPSTPKPTATPSDWRKTVKDSYQVEVFGENAAKSEVIADRVVTFLKSKNYQGVKILKYHLVTNQKLRTYVNSDYLAFFVGAGQNSSLGGWTALAEKWATNIYLTYEMDILDISLTVAHETCRAYFWSKGDSTAGGFHTDVQGRLVVFETDPVAVCEREAIVGGAFAVKK